ncbi:MAG: c-type cytochrome, partial [Sphingomonadaceae bacterium]
MFARALPFALLLVAVFVASAPAHADVVPAQTVWRLLDYIAVDYREAVEDGKIVNQTEYDEMVEFSASARERIATLPTSSAKPGLQRRAAELEQIIAGRNPPERIASAARALAVDLIKAYPVPLAPSISPDLARGRALYAEHCASCHGVTGDGKGPAGVGLDPPPIAFTEEVRARERSVFALYQVIEQGLDGTSMVSFAELPPQDRWALAFYSGSLAYPASNAAEGERLWQADAALRSGFDLETLVGLTPAALAATVGEDKAKLLVAYLRRHPESATAEQAGGSLALARGRLNEALAAYERRDRKAATDLALSAYLDGFEPVEPVLAARDNALMIRIEGAMADLRAGIAKGAPDETVRAQVAALDDLFAEAETVLAPSEASAASSFLAAFTILV